LNSFILGKCQCGHCNEDISIRSQKGYLRRFKHGHAVWGNRNPKWNNGTSKRRLGYISLYLPNHPYCDSRGYILEHRLVMETYIGRYLTKTEVVHHINRNVKDNRIENLELFVSNGEHISITLIKDMSDRFCYECKTKEPYKDKNGRSQWNKHPYIKDKWICAKCLAAIRWREKHPECKIKYKESTKMDMSNRFCNLCNTNKTYITKNNYIIWHEDDGGSGWLCYYCYQNLKYQRKKFGI
jgi:hypothetical protein